MGRTCRHGKQKLPQYGRPRSRERDPFRPHVRLCSAGNPADNPGAGTISCKRGNAMSGTLGRAVLGFTAAALSVLIVHETIVYVLNMQGLVPRRGWNMTPPVPPFGVPYLVNLVIWGGLWGILFAF